MPFLRLAAAASLSAMIAGPAAAQPAARVAPQAVTVIVYSFGFAPRPIQLASGQPVTLTFVNRSRSSHDFVARAFFGNAQILAGDVMGGMVDLRGGETKTVRLIPRAGFYPVHCSHFFHKQLGMADQIIVH